MLYMKACPRCQGDVEFGSDWYGKYLVCLQCGYRIDSREGAIAAMRLAALGLAVVKTQAA